VDWFRSQASWNLWNSDGPACLRRTVLFLLRRLGGFLNEFRYSLKFLLKTGDEVGRPVLKKDDKAESEKHKQHEPEQTADETHAATLTYRLLAVNDLVRNTRQSPSLMLR